MKTTSRRRPLLSGTTLALGAFLILIIAAAALWRAAAAGLLWRVLSPVMQARDALESSELSQLQAQLASTTALVADRNMLYQENLDLKARLGRDAGIQAILADVLMRPPGTPYDTLLIDAGAAQGVATGQRVSAGGTTLIGTVTQVYATTARVELFSAPGQTYQAMLKGSVPLSVAGQGGGSMMAEVPAGTRAKPGDPVVFPDIQGGVAAVVSAVSAPSGSSFETIYLELPVNPLSLSQVEVWKQTK